jgi:hypothetical protein
MLRLLQHINWAAIAKALALAYAGPVLLACTADPGLWLFAFWLGAPTVAGYLAPYFARQLPLFHALCVALTGAVVFALILPPRLFAFWFIWLGVTVSCSIFGARIWKRHHLH